MIAHVHERTMTCGFLTSLASHGRRRTRSAAPWVPGLSASGAALEFVYKDQGGALGWDRGGALRLKNHAGAPPLKHSVWALAL